MSRKPEEKILIFIVSYNAGNHIQSVLNRLPGNVFNNPEFHVLVIDDCSKDHTAKTAMGYVSRSGYDNVTVLRNVINLGYGGNQKLGFRYALENGYSLVVLLHGDGQYPPEFVLRFVAEWKNRKADVVLGSRMLDKMGALRGNMPLYKWVGNQVLTFLQNKIVESRLSEFHTGYRAYDTRFLGQVPFELNTNDFHFDTEILLQAYALEAKIVEFPIPTHYGEEVCYVKGFRYAWNVVKACLKYRFQKVGLFCSMQYRGLLRHDQIYADKSEQMGSTHYQVLQYIKTPSRVLDLGCGPGFVSRELKARNCYVVGVDVVQPHTYPGDKFIKMDFENERMGEDISTYDYVLLLDILEHLSDPERFLINCRYTMQTFKQPMFFISTGNVAFLGVRLLLAMGLFNYGERGILDVTHKRLFTLASFRRFLRETGFEIGRVHGLGVPFQFVMKNWVGHLLGLLSYWMARVWPSLFAYQFLIEARPKPDTFLLLTNAEWFYGIKSSAKAESFITKG